MKILIVLLAGYVSGICPTGWLSSAEDCVKLVNLEYKKANWFEAAKLCLELHDAQLAISQTAVKAVKIIAPDTTCWIGSPDYSAPDTIAADKCLAIDSKANFVHKPCVGLRSKLNCVICSKKKKPMIKPNLVWIQTSQNPDSNETFVMMNHGEEDVLPTEPPTSFSMESQEALDEKTALDEESAVDYWLKRYIHSISKPFPETFDVSENEDPASTSDIGFHQPYTNLPPENDESFEKEAYTEAALFNEENTLVPTEEETLVPTEEETSVPTEEESLVSTEEESLTADETATTRDFTEEETLGAPPSEEEFLSANEEETKVPTSEPGDKLISGSEAAKQVIQTTDYYDSSLTTDGSGEKDTVREAISVDSERMPMILIGGGLVLGGLVMGSLIYNFG